jgi:cell division protein FtsW (lipid II flippase)
MHARARAVALDGGVRPVKHLDPVLVLTALALTGIGLVAIYSAKLQALTSQGLPTTLYVSRQLLALAIGIVVMVVIAVIDYRHLRLRAGALRSVSSCCWCWCSPRSAPRSTARSAGS